MDSSDIHLRLADPSDADEILDVCGSALGWTDPEFDRALFRWKHFDNAFGPSIIFVAENETGLLAVRPLMRWRFSTSADPTSGRSINAARAVDTATRPIAQGQGLFRRLTELGLEELRDQAFGFVFNTPNDQSRPGYLKMGWELAGHVEFGFAIRSPMSLPTIARSRTAAHKPSIETPELGIDIADGLAMLGSGVPLSSNVQRHSRTEQWCTAHTIETLRWRFEHGPISYRWLPTGADEGCVVRLRQRGPSRELLVALVAARSPTTAWDAVKQAMHQVRADYCLTPAGFGSARTIARLGPTLTLRPVELTPSAGSFDWSPGDIEIF